LIRRQKPEADRDTEIGLTNQMNASQFSIGDKFKIHGRGYTPKETFTVTEVRDDQIIVESNHKRWADAPLTIYDKALSIHTIELVQFAGKINNPEADGYELAREQHERGITNADLDAVRENEAARFDSFMDRSVIGDREILEAL
jgi:FKBP-type peptidyl-prolyl cis-trans isomerase 2